jgi:opacity protein-like surface antigen
MQKSFLLKILPLVILLGMTGLDVSAQYSIGIRGGINISNYWGTYLNSNFETKTAPVFGVAAQFQQNEWLSFQAELNWDVRGANYNRIIEDGVIYKIEYKDITQDANYLTLPVLAKFDLGEKQRVFGYGGLYAGLLVSANITGNEVITNKYPPYDVTTTPIDRDYKDEIKNFDMGAVLGMGADFRIGELIVIFIDGRYNWGWLNTARQGQGRIFNSVWSFNLGVMYNLKKSEN